MDDPQVQPTSPEPVEPATPEPTPPIEALVEREECASCRALFPTADLSDQGRFCPRCILLKRDLRQASQSGFHFGV